TAYLQADPVSGTGAVRLYAPDIDLESDLTDLPEGHPFRVLFQTVQDHLGIDHFPPMRVKIHSDIPMAAGFGSGTAVSVALIRGLTRFLGVELIPAKISDLAFEVEKIYHGTPSGVDNTVVAFERPVYFVRGQPPKPLVPGREMTFLIADSGFKSITSKVVEQVRITRERNPRQIDAIFDSIAALTQTAREMLVDGMHTRVGALMYQNHTLLTQLGVSCDPLDKLVRAAKEAGALGAKLSGAGQGGNVIALVQDADAARVKTALETAGAVNVFQTRLSRLERNAAS
ncbi:MAG: mevalonate kinase, partial [Anaerolineaceae bacterium]